MYIKTYLLVFYNMEQVIVNII